MSHGFEASKNGTKWSFLTPRLVARGFAILKFNYRSCGDGPEASDGKFEDTTLSNRVADYRAALDFLQGVDVDRERIAVIGSSFGGAVPVAARDPRVRAYVLLATPSRTDLLSEERMAAARKLGYVPLPSGKRLTTAILDDAAKHDLCVSARELGRPAIVIHGELDDDVPVEQAHELYSQTCPSPSS